MDRLNKLDVYYHDRLVGTMALFRNRLAAFAYSSDWIKKGFSISPFSLPLEKKVFMPKIDPFEGLFGVFADSFLMAGGVCWLTGLCEKMGLSRRRLAVWRGLPLLGLLAWER